MRLCLRRLNGDRHGLLALSQKILDRLVNVVFVFDARQDKVIDLVNVVFQFANELAAAVGAFDLAVAEQIDFRQEIRSSGD